MSEFTDEYVDLLIKQYWEQPRANAEIAAKAKSWEVIRDVLAEFPVQFDIGQPLVESEFALSDGSVLSLSDDSVLGVAAQAAIGDRLDILGRIVGVSRNQPEALNDEDYRLLIKVKIAQNVASAFMVSDDRISIQDVIELAFVGEAYVIDKQDMSLRLVIESDTVSPTLISLILKAKLLPKPQGVQYSVVANTTGETSFGFSEPGETTPSDIDGFSEINESPEQGGILMERYS